MQYIEDDDTLINLTHDVALLRAGPLIEAKVATVLATVTLQKVIHIAGRGKAKKVPVSTREPPSASIGGSCRIS